MIPRLMCTQHPDATVKVTANEEVDEALVAYTAYGCDEVMIDYEGKTTPYSQPKDITVKAYEAGLPLGEKFFLTPRMPNPRLEEFERSMLTLEAAILANYFSVKLMGRQAIRWIVLPMVTDIETLGLVYRMLLHKTEAYIKETGVKLEPPELIPLIEDAIAQLKADELISGLLKQMAQQPQYIRLFLGKSDSAVRHGHLASALAIVATLSKMRSVEKSLGIKIYPILGMGSPPFRGGINNPSLSHLETIQYVGYYTVTVQSAVRYDTSYDEYIKVRETILNACCLPSREINLPELEEIITKASSTYKSVVVKFADRIVQMARLIPGTRDRISWTVYGRNITAEDRVVNMPRAIVYTSAWYAMGLPPTFLDAPTVVELAKSDKLDLVLKALPSLRREWEYDAQFYDPQVASRYTSEDFVKVVNEMLDYLGINLRANGTYLSLLRMNRNESNILAMGKYRKFLG
ncbi:Phosphoenolpyruvate carboxylase [Pyrobaculum islandicum DSM 4184]|uniref:Phosphoenolpyruvate carboxylase n=1 Tax=Pyrobaculum islandicum (strain DSM 4184 / JCM 9189 / GEO3) TaxID=384616 RepID=CAPPA_PYRIL|nr:phosphoenolpyruvate carboxylase [Pyrobaculum islandicum]A1RR50.1 RecName: Full=Phosphoenolpyruvate carboxylase; Short=PEPC; Short=PEPCase [Pyrobaculum islandicum DSM 4184]ABL87432.1 Phosphoenolpyruvate carboxylase [Pyrobaculum islandicum DSM 4184]